MVIAIAMLTASTVQRDGAENSAIFELSFLGHTANVYNCMTANNL
jgi:hypothetical protein